MINEQLYTAMELLLEITAPELPQFSRDGGMQKLVDIVRQKASHDEAAQELHHGSIDSTAASSGTPQATSTVAQVPATNTEGDGLHKNYVSDIEETQLEQQPSASKEVVPPRSQPGKGSTNLPDTKPWHLDRVDGMEKVEATSLPEVEPPSKEQQQQLHQQELQAMVQSRKALEVAIKKMVTDHIQSHTYMIEDDLPMQTALSDSSKILAARLAELLPEKG